MTEYAERKDMMGNIDPKSLIITEIWLHKRRFELATVDYDKATLNHDYQTLHIADDNMAYYKGVSHGLVTALRYVLAQEAEANGRRVSAGMEEFDEVIEELVNGKQ